MQCFSASIPNGINFILLLPEIKTLNIQILSTILQNHPVLWLLYSLIMTYSNI